MRTVAATRQAPADLTSAPKTLTWLVFLRDNAKLNKLTKIEWALAAILPTCGQGQNITLSIKGLADILDSDRETVGNALKGLIAKGLVLYVGPGKNNKSVYRLTLPKLSVTPTAGVGHTDSKVTATPTADVGQTDTTSTRDQEVDQDEHQHPGDDVRLATTRSNRAKGSTRSTSTRATKASSASTKCRPVGEYVSDLQGCRDELARRLDVEPGQISVKPLAKQLHDLCARNGNDVVFSEFLDDEDFASDPIWPMSAGKDRPVGFFMFVLKQRIEEDNDPTIGYRHPAAPMEFDLRVVAKELAEYALDHGRVCHFQGGQFGGIDSAGLEEAMKLLAAEDDRFVVYESILKGHWELGLRRTAPLDEPDF